MKRLTLIILILLTLRSIHAKAQKVDTVLFKHAQKIIVKNKLSQADNFKKSGMALINIGYMIHSKDEQFGQLISEPYKISFGEQVFYVVAKDNEIDITSKYISKPAIKLFAGQPDSKPADPVLYNKHDDYAIDKFNNMMALAKALQGDKIYYSE